MHISAGLSTFLRRGISRRILRSSSEFRLLTKRAEQGALMYRRLRLAVAAGVLLGLGATCAASAADTAVKARPVAAPIMYNWTGCYIGGNVGGAWSRMDTTRISQDGVGPAFANYGRENDSGFIGGGQAGCDFQTGNLVFGVGGEFDFGNVNGRHALTDLPAFSETNSLQQLYLITGRVGYLWTPQFLGYVKVGAAFMQNRNQVFLPSGGLFESAKFTDPGITAGIGGEWMFAPNWSVFAEANYVWTEDDAAHDYIAAPGLFPLGEVINNRQRIISALVGVNYKFHWDGPVVAKY
jgi:outer membrane immunogenic protein